jgi:hypothetical protein
LYNWNKFFIKNFWSFGVSGRHFLSCSIIERELLEGTFGLFVWKVDPDYFEKEMKEKI